MISPGAALGPTARLVLLYLFTLILLRIFILVLWLF